MSKAADINDAGEAETASGLKISTIPDDALMTGVSPKPRAKMADSVFTNLFKIPEYSLQLYQALHPEDKHTTKELIRIVTLENVLLNQSYNDFGMIIRGMSEENNILPNDDDILSRKGNLLDTENPLSTSETIKPETLNQPEPADKFLILCEAQSTWSLNILIRMLIYWAQTLQEYIVESQQNLYSSKKIQFPVPEFYVIYTGERKTQPEILSLSEEFGVLNADLRIKMIYDGQKGDIINQYVTFVKVYKEQYKLYGRTQKTILETLRICKNQNILKDYLESRKKEVVDIMMTLFDDETIMDAYTKEVKDETRMAEKRETALTLSDMGLSPEKISQAVKVSVKTVKQWLDSRIVAAK